MTVRISGLINTWNEADTVRYAIASLASWCDAFDVPYRHFASLAAVHTALLGVPPC